MRTFKNYMDAAKARREETGESGFSLIELIIVVVIIGILAAIALPLFGQIQKQAIDGATESATKNAATTAVADVAQDATGGPAKATTDVAAVATKTGNGIVLVLSGTTPAGICVSGYNPNGSKYVTGTGTSVFKSGPGC